MMRLALFDLETYALRELVQSEQEISKLSTKSARIWKLL